MTKVFTSSNIVTTRNVYTEKVMDLCPSHYDARANGDVQIEYGLHTGFCDVCDKRPARIISLNDGDR